MENINIDINIDTPQDINNDTKYDTNHLPWIEKYRPISLDHIISQDKVILSLKNFIKNKNLPNLIFYGPSGTGKTSTIMACAYELYKENTQFMVMELNASDERGIETVRTRIKQFVVSKTFLCNNTLFKLVILDEIDAMTNDAQAILRKIIEDNTKNVRFCLICNYLNKINTSLQSRCICFKFIPLQTNIIIDKIQQIIVKENIHISDDGISQLLNNTSGDMRKILNILQSLNSTYQEISSKIINNSLCLPSQDIISNILNHLFNHSFKDTFVLINDYKKNDGISLIHIITEIHSILLNKIDF